MEDRRSDISCSSSVNCPALGQQRIDITDTQMLQADGSCDIGTMRAWIDASATSGVPSDCTARAGDQVS